MLRKNNYSCSRTGPFKSSVKKAPMQLQPLTRQPAERPKSETRGQFNPGGDPGGSQRWRTTPGRPPNSLSELSIL
jgi:hypothetical protein